MKTKSLVAIFAIILVAISAIFSTTVFAADATYTVTLNGSDVTSRTYDAYRLFDISGTDGDYTYTWTAEANSFFQTYAANMEGFATENEDGTYTVTEAQAVAYLQSLESDSEELLAFAKAYTGTAVASSAVNDGVNAISGLTAGYYLIHETDTLVPTSVNMLLPVVENTPLNVKAEAVPTPEKTAKDAEGEELTTVAVGDVVTFEITGIVPDTRGYDAYTYNIVDTMTGLDFNSISSVTISTAEGTPITLETTDYTLGAQTLTVELGSYLLAHPELRGQTITVTYTATVNEDAAENSMATNTVKIQYSTNPSTQNGGTPSETDTTTVTLYTYNVTLTKTNVVGRGLEGAVFNLVDAEGNTVKTGLTTNANGVVEITGIDAGTYTLTETTAPEGYTARDYVFTINASTPENATLVNTNDDDYLRVNKATTAEASKSEDGDVTTVVYTPFEIQLINSNGSILPSTGGVGTTIFTIVGILVMIATAVAFVMINRKK